MNDKEFFDLGWCGLWSGVKRELQGTVPAGMNGAGEGMQLPGADLNRRELGVAGPLSSAQSRVQEFRGFGGRSTFWRTLKSL